MIVAILFFVTVKTQYSVLLYLSTKYMFDLTKFSTLEIK